jgi:hypothetical protein
VSPILTFSPQMLNRIHQGFRLHHHPRSSTKGPIIHRVMFVFCVIPQLVNPDFDKTGTLRPTQNAFG